MKYIDYIAFFFSSRMLEALVTNEKVEMMHEIVNDFSARGSEHHV